MRHRRYEFRAQARDAKIVVYDEVDPSASRPRRSSPRCAQSGCFSVSRPGIISIQESPNVCTQTFITDPLQSHALDEIAQLVAHLIFTSNEYARGIKHQPSKWANIEHPEQLLPTWICARPQKHFTVSVGSLFNIFTKHLRH